jgi:hypothetical protein
MMPLSTCCRGAHPLPTGGALDSFREPGIELASIVLIHQHGLNLAFAWYQSLTTIPVPCAGGPDLPLEWVDALQAVEFPCDDQPGGIAMSWAGAGFS